MKQPVCVDILATVKPARYLPPVPLAAPVTPARRGGTPRHPRHRAAERPHAWYRVRARPACNRALWSQGWVEILAQSGETIAEITRLHYDGTMRFEATTPLVKRFIPFAESRRARRAHGINCPRRLVYRLNLDMMKPLLPTPLARSITSQQVRTWMGVIGQEMHNRMENRMEYRMERRIAK